MHIALATSQSRKPKQWEGLVPGWPADVSLKLSRYTTGDGSPTARRIGLPSRMLCLSRPRDLTSTVTWWSQDRRDGNGNQNLCTQREVGAAGTWISLSTEKVRLRSGLAVHMRPGTDRPASLPSPVRPRPPNNAYY